MKKKAIITVSSRQINEENNDEDVEVVTPGNFYKKEDSYYAVYEETEISGMKGTTTTLKIEDNKLSLIRIGSTSSKMEFDEKKENVSMYTTPYGTLQLKIKTSDLDVDVNDYGGDVTVNYDLSIVGQVPVKTVLKININPNKN
ncbi:DUF1934 domain-containing protein [Clostridium sp. JN-9]|uniref:DUF1934 domain-containing protein n=1 Tax=Clostridium sp. JN-9 TaxID=2507159 RepID=UPI000FFE1306|nr:DUF1934 domain-containing protein [Clostridium sp. JN-9]QAT38961.1 DUF1934 domain-containing protein [Clostridium sp. JN-9]